MQKRTMVRRSAPTALFLALAIWVGAVFMIVGSNHHPVTKQPTTVQQANAH